jgi:hypothetical protein
MARTGKLSAVVTDAARHYIGLAAVGNDVR